MAQIVIRNLRKEFGGFTAVQSSSFTVEDGEFFMLLGPSGCGKTTTLRMIAGLELPTSGEILHRRRGRQPEAREPARHRLRLPDVRALPAHERAPEHCLSAGQRRECAAPTPAPRCWRWRASSVSRTSSSGPLGGLSGGDRQRVALGRAIVRDPKCFLMDEPLGALDAEFREHMAEELRALHDRMRATTVYVTHDQLEAMQMGDKIVVMNHGVVEQFGAPQEIYDWPATMFVADFIGSPPMNFLRFDGTVAAGSPRDRARRIARRGPGEPRGRRGRTGARGPARACPAGRRRRLPRHGPGGGIPRHHPDRDRRDRARHAEGPRPLRRHGRRGRPGRARLRRPRA